MSNNLLSKSDIDTIFMNLDEIIGVNTQLLSSLESFVLGFEGSLIKGIDKIIFDQVTI